MPRKTKQRNALRSPVFCRLLPRLERLARKDARTMRRSLDGIIDAALIYLFSLKAAERLRFYNANGIKEKVFGRPLQ